MQGGFKVADLSKLGGCGGGSALKLNGLQNGWEFLTQGAYPGETTVVYSITTTLEEALSVNVPDGKQMLLDVLYVPSSLSTTQMLTVEVEVDGVKVIAATGRPNGGQLTFLGVANGSDSGSTRILVNSNFKLRIKTETGAQSNINFRYRYYLI